MLGRKTDEVRDEDVGEHTFNFNANDLNTNLVPLEGLIKIIMYKQSIKRTQK
jgi:hypothetical protein